MKRIAILVSVLSIQVSMAGAATAADGETPGLYLQGAFAMQATTGDLKDAIDTIDGDTNFYGGSLALGYFLTDWLALQARIQFLSGTGTGTFTPPPGLDISTYNLLYTGAVKVYPLSLLTGSADGLIQPYAILGIGGQTFTASLDLGSGTWLGSGSTTGFLLEAGGGVDVMLSQSFGIFGEVTYDYANDSDFTITESASSIGMNAGITYRF